MSYECHINVTKVAIGATFEDIKATKREGMGQFSGWPRSDRGDTARAHRRHITGA